jgi:hypothetical protein
LLIHARQEARPPRAAPVAGGVSRRMLFCQIR